MEKILLLEDDAALGSGIGMALQTPQTAVVLCHTLEEARRELAQEVFSLLILDINLPDGSGLELLREQKSIHPEVPAILLTANDLELDEVTGLEAGADDYITKPFGMMEFIARVKAVLRRSRKHTGEKEFCYKGLKVNVERRQVWDRDRNVELTLKEFELLRYLIENQGIVLSRNQILEKIWGYEFAGETRTVDVHIRTLRQKLGDSGFLIETVRGVGYRIGDKQ